MQLLQLGFPYSFVLLGIGLLVGFGITIFFFGVLFVSIFILMYCLGMIHINPLLEYIQKWILFLFPGTVNNLQQRINKNFKIGNKKVLPVIQSPSIFLFHPHGIFCTSCYFHTLTGETNWPYTSKTAILDKLFSLPFANELSQRYNVVPSKYNLMKKVIEDGNNLSVVPGGVREMLYYSGKANTIQLTLKTRKGVFKLALETGASLVPVLTYGENELFELADLPGLGRIQKWLYEKGISLPIPTFQSLWRWIMGNNPPIITFIGDPIPVEKATATNEAIDFLRAKYITALEDLYNKTKPDDYAEKIIIN